jgi:hypothetical protein
MPNRKNRKLADHPPHERGPKTHHADILNARGEKEEPSHMRDPEVKQRAEEEKMRTDPTKR